MVDGRSRTTQAAHEATEAECRGFAWGSRQAEEEDRRITESDAERYAQPLPLSLDRELILRTWYS